MTLREAAHSTADGVRFESCRFGGGRGTESGFEFAGRSTLSSTFHPYRGEDLFRRIDISPLAGWRAAFFVANYKHFTLPD